MNWRRGILSGRLSADWVINPWVRGGFSVALAVVLGLALWQNAQTLKSFETWMNSFGKPILRDAFVVTSDLMRLERTLDAMFAKAALQPDTVQADPSPEVLARLELDLIWIRLLGNANRVLSDQLKYTLLAKDYFSLI